jgi:hypothetical protein
VTAPVDPPRRSAGARALVVVAVVVAATAVVLALLAWGQPIPALTAQDARQFSADAFEAAGFTEGAVRPDVEASSYRDEDGDETFDVWITITDLEGQPVELWIDRNGSQAVQVDDNTDGGPLLTDEQFQILDDYEVHPRADERRRRNSWVTAAAAVAVAVAVGVIVVTGRTKRAPSPSPEPEPERQPKSKPEPPPP